MQKSPLAEADTLCEELLQDLPADVAGLAREFKAFTRGRKIKTPQQLLRVVLLYCGLDQSLREVAGTLTVLGEQITDSSVITRLKAGEPWVKALLKRMLPGLSELALPAGYRFRVLDGSSIEGPGANGTWYRLHLSIDLCRLSFTEIIVSDKHTGESVAHFALGAGDVAVMDRGYCRPQALIDVVAAGAQVVVRWNSAIPLWDRDGQPLDLVQTLWRQAAEQGVVPVLMGPAAGQNRIAGYLHACRLPPEQAEAARRRLRRTAQKKGRTLKQATLYLAGWVVFTSLPPTVLATQTVLALYRLRWQVELAIKRWKSVLDVDGLRAKEGSTLAQVWLHGKLLYARLLERHARRLNGEQWGYLDQPRHATWWRPWKLMAQAIAPLITGAAYWQPAQWAACIELIKERPRRRQLQRFPAAVMRLMRDACPTGIAPPLQALAA
jgi:hypothetical protein